MFFRPIQEPTPVAKWQMENDWTDAVGTFDGTAYGSPVFGDPIAGGSYSATFDGSNDYIDVGNDASLRPGAMTICGWVKPGQNTVDQTIVARWDSVGGVNQRCFVFGVNASGKLYLRVTSSGSSDGDLAVSATTLKIGYIYFVSGTWDGSTIKIYVNAVADGTPVSHSGIFESTNQTTIGAVGGRVGTDYPVALFTGSMHDMRMYNSALTATELAVIMGTPTVIFSLTPATDATAGGAEITITGLGFTGTTSVKFGTDDAASYTVDSDTQITATTPAHATASVRVTVVSPNGTSADSTADDFVFADLAHYSVSGAGDANENGTYDQVADINGKMGLMNENGWYMYYDGYGGWQISDSQPYGMPYHYVTSSADTPPTSGWSPIFGSGTITVTQL